MREALPQRLNYQSKETLKIIYTILLRELKKLNDQKSTRKQGMIKTAERELNV